ncbi:MAG: HepT-like ribonuclease domain-containing protein [Thermoleophilaceae bacterium]
MRDDRLYLIHIKECIDRIQQYVEDGPEAFAGSTLIQDAVLRNFQTIGQSAGRIVAIEDAPTKARQAAATPRPARAARRRARFPRSSRPAPSSSG